MNTWYNEYQCANETFKIFKFRSSIVVHNLYKLSTVLMLKKYLYDLISKHMKFNDLMPVGMRFNDVYEMREEIGK